jgi:3-hydroxyisobutyrate dehydrogenase-like beta-hydroxyacid dehydrogenase
MNIPTQDVDAPIGFIGLGVMGEPVCRNLARKTGRKIIGFDVSEGPLRRLADFGVEAASSVASLAKCCGTVFVMLPSGQHVESISLQADGLLANVRAGAVIVDLGTSGFELTRRLAEQFSKAGACFVDAPVARTRQAAEDGTLSVMVGATEEVFAALGPLLSTFASDITLCGGTGSGQVVKILNNMVLIETVVALSEALSIARGTGVDGRVLFETLMKGSADSFALRNHGMKAVLPDTFPERAFSTAYARKDLSYALQLGTDMGVHMAGAATADRLLESAIAKGYGDLYWPVISRVVGNGSAR